VGEGSVWFRASIGAKKNAEARWLLPMICRRGGIDKHDIGAIRIMDTTTEFEISERAAESFAVKIRRPDKEDNIRIEPLGDAPRGEAIPEKRSHAPRREARDTDRSVPDERSREERTPKPHGKPHSEAGTGFGREPGFKKKKKFPHKPAHAGPPPHASAAKPGSGKKVKHRTRR
jgi:ATP-dependent RNA helicase DeaD